MNVQDAAKAIGCNERYIRALINGGKLKATKKTVKGQKGPPAWFIYKRSLKSFLKKNPPARGWQRGKKRG